MTQKECLLDLFRRNGYRLTLGDILKSAVGYEWRARATELRREGYRIMNERVDRESPSRNLYVLEEKQEIKVERNGQRLII